MQQHYSNIKSPPPERSLQQHKQLAWLNESKQRLIPLKNPHHTETTVGKASTSFVKFASLFCIQWMLLSRGFLQISTSEGFTLYMQRRPRLSSMHIKRTSLIHKTTYHILSTMRYKKKFPSQTCSLQLRSLMTLKILCHFKRETRILYIHHQSKIWKINRIG